MADNSMTFSNCTLMQLGGEDFLRELTQLCSTVSWRLTSLRHQAEERSDER